MNDGGAVLSHPSGIPQRIVEKVVARRGRLHAYEALKGATTALVVIDMTEACAENDVTCRTIAPIINRLADAVRGAGGVVAWVRPRPLAEVDGKIAKIIGDARARYFFETARDDDPRSALFSGLQVATQDLHALKTGASAFFPGKCDLDDRLSARAIETVLVAGTVTNVCCESSARDAVELGYDVVMVSDALAGHSFGLHEASLATFYRIFGDVRPADEVMRILT